MTADYNAAELSKFTYTAFNEMHGESGFGGSAVTFIEATPGGDVPVARFFEFGISRWICVEVQVVEFGFARWEEAARLQPNLVPVEEAGALVAAIARAHANSNNFRAQRLAVEAAAE